jgi:hypothetical protein
MEGSYTVACSTHLDVPRLGVDSSHRLRPAAILMTTRVKRTTVTRAVDAADAAVMTFFVVRTHKHCSSSRGGGSGSDVRHSPLSLVRRLDGPATEGC